MVKQHGKDLSRVPGEFYSVFESELNNQLSSSLARGPDLA